MYLVQSGLNKYNGGWSKVDGGFVNNTVFEAAVTVATREICKRSNLLGRRFGEGASTTNHSLSSTNTGLYS